MKSTAIYSSLTMPQRMRAMTSAFGRADHEELDRLAETSRDGSYTVLKVRHQFARLTHLAALHNSLLLEPCALWLFAQTISPHELPALSIAETRAIATCCAQSLAEGASIEAAFTARITGAGIDTSDWQIFRERLLDKSGKHLLQLFLTHAFGHEIPALVVDYSDAIEGYLFKDAA